MNSPVKNIFGVLLGAALLSIMAGMPAQATGCTVTAHGALAQTDSAITATFEVKGNNNCKPKLTLTSWSNGQTIYAQTSGTFSAGTHTLSVKRPDCFARAELSQGTNEKMRTLEGDKKCGVIVNAAATPALPETGMAIQPWVLTLEVAAAGAVGVYIRRRLLPH